MPRDPRGRAIARSWLYYGLNPERAKGGYFLKVNNYKNCHYHILDMRLLRDAFLGLGRDADLSGFTTVREDLGRSIVKFMVGAYEAKAADGLLVDSPTIEGGNYAGCNPDLFEEELFRHSDIGTIIEDLKAVSHDQDGRAETMQ